MIVKYTIYLVQFEIWSRPWASFAKRPLITEIYFWSRKKNQFKNKPKNSIACNILTHDNSSHVTHLFNSIVFSTFCSVTFWNWNWLIYLINRHKTTHNIKRGSKYCSYKHIACKIIYKENKNERWDWITIHSHCCETPIQYISFCWRNQLPTEDTEFFLRGQRKLGRR